MPHPPLALRQYLASTPGLSRRASVSALLLSPWLMPRVGAQVVQPVDSGGHSGVQLAMPWPAGRSPQGFWVSEKFDGVRAVWDGRVLRFRSGRAIAAPAWFLSALPRVALDGELWTARGAFDRLSGVVRQAEPDDEAWRAVKYLVFDAPGHAAPFAQRVAFVQTTLAQAQQPWLMPVAQREVNDARALQALLQETVRQGGEGLMLHRRAVQAQTRAGRRGSGGGPPAGQRAFAGHDRGFAGANAVGPAFCPGIWPERCPAPQPATLGGVGHLPLPRSHALGLAAFCVFLAGARVGVSHQGYSELLITCNLDLMCIQ